jgi:alanine racemase
MAFGLGSGVAFALGSGVAFALGSGVDFGGAGGLGVAFSSEGTGFSATGFGVEGLRNFGFGVGAWTAGVARGMGVAWGLRRPNKRPQKPGLVGMGVATGIGVGAGFVPIFRFLDGGADFVAPPGVCTFGSTGGGEITAGVATTALSCAWVRSKISAAQTKKARKNRDMVYGSERPYLRGAPRWCKAIPLWWEAIRELRCMAFRENRKHPPMSPLSSASVHRTWVEIAPAALIHNIRAVQEAIGANVGIIAVVKADAYGHGLKHVVPALAPHAKMFGVANLAEAHAVRAIAPKQPVLLLGPALPQERADVVASGFIPMVSSVDEAAAYSALARLQPAPIHLKLDTGMGRIGIWHEDALAVVREIASLHGVTIAGLASHLPVADQDEVFTQLQLAVFHRRAAELRAHGLPDVPLHIANSAGAIGFPEQAGDFVRIGLALYGCSPRREFQPQFRPALTWKTRVLLVRDVPAGHSVSYGRTFITSQSMRIATLAVGYADGYRRHLSGTGAEVLIGGNRCAVLGRVTMDQIMADVTALDSVEPGDEVVLIGQQGGDEVSVAELAEKGGTIPWEIFTGIGERVARVLV